MDRICKVKKGEWACHTRETGWPAWETVWLNKHISLMQIEGTQFQLNPPFIVGGKGVGMWMVTNHEHRCSMELLIRKNFFQPARFRGFVWMPTPQKGLGPGPKDQFPAWTDLSLGIYHKAIWQFWRWNRHFWRLTASVTVGVEEMCFCDGCVCGGGCEHMCHEKHHWDACRCSERGDGQKECIASEFP